MVTLEELDARVTILEKKTKHMAVPNDKIVKSDLADEIGFNEEQSPTEKR